MITNIVYLGPQGSYSNLATKKFSRYFNNDCHYIEVESIFKIVQFLKEKNKDAFAAVIPLENSIEGVVCEVQDNLSELAKIGYKILAETTLHIEHSLIGYGIESEINEIKSHPQALAQCREYIYKNLGKDVSLTPALSTSDAVKNLNSNSHGIAAIGNKYCASLYGLPIIKEGINDEKNNTTRFILVSKFSPTKENLNKVSITFSTVNKAGALSRVLCIFEKYGLNLSYISSRPSRLQLGEYVFYADFEGHIKDNNIALALTEIQPLITKFAILSEGAVLI